MVAIGMLIALAGCATTPAPLPEPPPAEVVVVCATPAGMTEIEARPAAPRGEEYSQRDVARYIQALHRHATRGWLRVESIRAYARDCQQRAETD